MFKWILAVGGYFVFRGSFLGAVLGFIVGTFIDTYQRMNTAQQQQGGGGNGRRQQFTAEDFFNFYQQQRANAGNDVPTMLMALSAAVMRADGKVLKAELDYVKAFFNQQFGPQFSQHHLQTLKRFLDSGDIPLQRITQDIRMRMAPEVRTQLVHYMFGIAKADGSVSESELNVIRQIADMLGVSAGDFNSLKNMFYRDVNSDYAILGVESSASDDEIKRAYRQMAIRFHPDKVSQMGEEYQQGAKEKFQKIQEAYEAIKKSRGIR